MTQNKTYIGDKRILLVDDEPFNLFSLKILMLKAFRKYKIPKEVILNLIDTAKDGNEYIQKV